MCWVSEQSLWEVVLILARWFRFQLSEIDGLAIPEFLRWATEAQQQIKRENGDRE